MCAGQSIGLGTNAGDQQYVNGIFKDSARLGPCTIAIGSKSRVARHLLITSPSLHVSVSSFISQCFRNLKHSYPCQVSHSATPKETRFAILGSIREGFKLARG